MHTLETRTLLDHPRGVSFTVVAEAPGFEVVLGILGRFWTPSGQLKASAPG